MLLPLQVLLLVLLLTRLSQTLLPGTVIMTGTPAGVGYARDPPCWLAPGDVVEVEVKTLQGSLPTNFESRSLLFIPAVRWRGWGCCGIRWWHVRRGWRRSPRRTRSFSILEKFSRSRSRSPCPRRH